MYSVIKDATELGSLLKELLLAKRIGLDIESTSLDPYTATILLVQLNVNDKIFLLDARSLGTKYITYVLQIIRDSNIQVVGHNLKFDLKMLYGLTKELLTNVHDTMIAEMIMFAGLNTKFPALDELVEKYCFVIMNKETRKSFIDFTGILTNDQLTYSALDVRYLLDIQDYQIKELEKQNQLHILELENGLVPYFAKMEYVGIKLDVEAWTKLSDEQEKRVRELGNMLLYDTLHILKFSEFSNALELAERLAIPVQTKKLRTALENIGAEYSGNWLMENLNLNSPYQVKEILSLFGVNVPDTNENTIRKYSSNTEVKLLLKYREAQRLVSAYGKEFLNHINPITDAIHTDYDQLKSTGRIGSSNPNLQNQPREQRYRDCYIAREGKSLITADYSQAELRLVGAVSGEPVLINAYKNNEDIHKKTATIIYNIPESEVNKEQRFNGKTLNFSLIYGISEYGLYRKNDIPIETGKEWIDRYFNTYVYIREFMRIAGDAIWKSKVSITPYGRKRYFKDKKIYASFSDELKYKEEVKREGRNHIIQGGVADAIKIAMLSIGRENPFGDKFNMLLQVHDELVIEVDEDIVEEASRFIKTHMIESFQKFLREIPAEVDIAVGKCWSK